jgi:hypothetical protein
MAGWSQARDTAHHAQDEASCLRTFRTEHAVRIGLPAPGGTARFHTLGGPLAALCLRMGIPARGPGGYEVFPVWRSAQAGEPEGLPPRLEHDDGVTAGLSKFPAGSCGFSNIRLRHGDLGGC